MGGVPAAIGGALSSAGGAIGGAAKSFWGAGKDALNENYVQPWKNGIDDMRGTPATPAPGGATTGDGSAMKSFFNAPAVETPAMRLRRMQQEQA